MQTHPMWQIDLSFVSYKLQYTSMRLSLVVLICEFEQHWILDIETSQLEDDGEATQLKLPDRYRAWEMETHLIQGRWGHNNLATLLHVMSFIAWQHGHRVALVCLDKGTVHHVAQEIEPS